MPARLLASGLAALTLVVAVACCHRGADELPSSSGPVSTSASVVASPSPSGSAGTDRCVIATPEVPPPPVAPGPAVGCPVDPAPHTLPPVTVRFPEASRGEATVRAELARKPADNERGLMYRTSMDADSGMLFDLGDRSVHTFWMHNTCIPLDMLFLDEDGLVVGIVENAPTLNDVPRSVACPSTHVLEVNAGWSRRHGVRAGQHAVLPGA